MNSQQRIAVLAVGFAAVIAATLVPAVAGALRQELPDPNTKKVLVTAFRGDLDAGPQLAEAIRSRIAATFSVPTLMPTSARDIEITLQQANYRSDPRLSPDDIRELAKLVHADEVIDGTIAKTTAGYRVIARMFLPRDLALSQPLVTDAEVKDIGEAAKIIVDEYSRARRQLLSSQACENGIRANTNAVAIAIARNALRDYPKATLLRLCMASAYANMKMGADSTQPWKDSVIAITREIIKLDKNSRIAYHLQYDAYKAKHDTANALTALIGLANSGGARMTDVGSFDPPSSRSAELAVPTARQLVADNPGDPQYARTYWLVLRAAKNYKESVPAGMAYVVIDTAAADSNYFFRQLADLQADSSFAKAVEIAAIGAAKFPKSTSLLLQKARNERRAGQLPAAKASLERSLEIDPKVNGANLLLASISAEMDNADDAIKYAKADAAADAANKPRDAQFLLQLGNTQYRAAAISKTADDYKKAIPFLQASDDMAPSANAKYLLGVSAFQLVIASMDRLPASTSCDDFKTANDLLTIGNSGMGAGGFVDPNTMKQLMERAMQFAPFIERAMKKYCE